MPSAELPEIPIPRERRSESACYFSCHNRTLQFSCRLRASLGSGRHPSRRFSTPLKRCWAFSTLEEDAASIQCMIDPASVHLVLTTLPCPPKIAESRFPSSPL